MFGAALFATICCVARTNFSAAAGVRVYVDGSSAWATASAGSMDTMKAIERVRIGMGVPRVDSVARPEGRSLLFVDRAATADPVAGRRILYCDPEAVKTLLQVWFRNAG